MFTWDKHQSINCDIVEMLVGSIEFRQNSNLQITDTFMLAYICNNYMQPLLLNRITIILIRNSLLNITKNRNFLKTKPNNGACSIHLLHCALTLVRVWVSKPINPVNCYGHVCKCVQWNEHSFVGSWSTAELNVYFILNVTSLV